MGEVEVWGVECSKLDGSIHDFLRTRLALKGRDIPAQGIALG